MTPNLPKSTSIGYTPVGEVKGLLIDETTGHPITNMQVALGRIADDGKAYFNFNLGKPGNSAITDSTGAFTIEAPPDAYILASPGGNPSDKIATSSENVPAAANIPLLIVVIRAGLYLDLGKVQMRTPPFNRGS
jgi:hypothetical protein